MITVKPVPIEYVNRTWPMVAHYIQDALEQGVSGEWMYNISHIQGYVTSGQWILLVAVDEQNNIHGAGTLSIYNQPLHRIAFVTAVGGRLISNRDTVEQVKNIARQNGCTALQAFGRPSIVRLWRRYNFKPTNTLVEVLL